VSVRTCATVVRATVVAVAFLELTPFDASAQDAGAPVQEGRTAEGPVQPLAPDEAVAPPEPKVEGAARFASFGSAPTNGSLENVTPPGTPRADPSLALARNARWDHAAAAAETPDGENPIDCDSHFMRAADVQRCRTPREGTLSGGYVAVDLGFVTPKTATADRVGIGGGFAGNLRVGFEFWDQLVIGGGFGFFNFDDQRPTSQSVVTCYSTKGVQTGCDSSPHEEQSSVTAWAGIVEAGYQRRFRPSRGISLTPGLLMGVQLSPSMSRGVSNCSDCSSRDLNASASGVFLSPFFRVTFGRNGAFGLAVRSEWFVVGDILQTTVFGVEYGLP
jgi:hypothetical protein